ncbi:MAG: hypothetical protein ACXAD7_12550 [Candidatus Kariarchaeaceae archaeon]|jgi:hypothetical protein
MNNIEDETQKKKSLERITLEWVLSIILVMIVLYITIPQSQSIVGPILSSLVNVFVGITVITIGSGHLYLYFKLSHPNL